MKLTEAEDNKSIPFKHEGLVHRLRIVADERKTQFGHPGICAEAADEIEQLQGVKDAWHADAVDWREQVVDLKNALQRIADMTEIETDFDGFEARQIARDALAERAA